MSKRWNLWIFGLLSLLTIIGNAKADDSQSNAWPDIFTASISASDCNSFKNPGWIPLPIDPSAPEKRTFRLFYTLNHPIDPALPNAIFIDGGPGGIVSPSREPNADRLDNRNWNLVSFHVRGAGCSQLPPDNSYDTSITHANIISDMEALRVKLGLPSWDLVVGESYGSWLAQMYASEKPSSVRHLLVEGIYNPLWANGSKSDVHHALLQAEHDAIATVAKRDRNLFSPPLSDSEINALADQVSEDSDQIDSAKVDLYAFVFFPAATNNLMFSIRRLKQYRWSGYGPEFFQAIAMLPYMGTLPLRDSLAKEQDSILIAIANSVFPGRLANPKFLTMVKGTLQRGFSFDSSSTRLFPVLSYRDSDALYSDTNSVKKFPSVKVPTLYVNGTLDGSTPMEGAKEMAENSCTGSCVFVSVQGGGHSATNLSKDCFSALLSALMTDDMSLVRRTAEEDRNCQMFTGVQATLLGVRKNGN